VNHLRHLAFVTYSNDSHRILGPLAGPGWQSPAERVRPVRHARQRDQRDEWTLDAVCRPTVQPRRGDELRTNRRMAVRARIARGGAFNRTAKRARRRLWAGA
jgi:hypothetical protein